MESSTNVARTPQTNPRSATPTTLPTSSPALLSLLGTAGAVMTAAPTALAVALLVRGWPSAATGTSSRSVKPRPRKRISRPSLVDYDARSLSHGGRNCQLAATSSCLKRPAPGSTVAGFAPLKSQRGGRAFAGDPSVVASPRGQKSTAGCTPTGLSRSHSSNRKPARPNLDLVVLAEVEAGVLQPARGGEVGYQAAIAAAAAGQGLRRPPRFAPGVGFDYPDDRVHDRLDVTVAEGSHEGEGLDH